MEFELGEYTVVGRHKDCGGRVVEYSQMKINGKIHPKNAEDRKWRSCLKKKWEERDELGRKIQFWTYCGMKEKSGDLIILEV